MTTKTYRIKKPAPPLAATGTHLPPPVLPPTAAELSPAPPDPGPCPTCGQSRPNLVNTWATGSPALAVPTRLPHDPPDPDGPEGQDAYRDVTAPSERYAPPARRVAFEER